jgi:hypothetical protein
VIRFSVQGLGKNKTSFEDILIGQSGFELSWKIYRSKVSNREPYTLNLTTQLIKKC